MTKSGAVEEMNSAVDREGDMAIVEIKDETAILGRME